jgi:hypothetical protein
MTKNDFLLLISLISIFFSCLFWFVYKLICSYINGKIILDPTKLNLMKDVSRIEIIDYTVPLNPFTRKYVKYLKNPEKLEISIQNEGKTMKIFISNNK